MVQLRIMILIRTIFSQRCFIFFVALENSETIGAFQTFIEEKKIVQFDRNLTVHDAYSRILNHPV